MDWIHTRCVHPVELLINPQRLDCVVANSPPCFSGQRYAPPIKFLYLFSPPSVPDWYVLQDIDDLVQFGLDDCRARGGVDVDALMQAARGAGLNVAPDISMEVLRAELESQMESSQGSDSASVMREPQKGTVRWYQQNADEPIAAGVPVTVRQACFCIAALKLHGGITVSAVDTMCRLLACGGFLHPEANIMPRFAYAPCRDELCCVLLFTGYPSSYVLVGNPHPPPRVQVGAYSQRDIGPSEARCLWVGHV